MEDGRPLTMADPQRIGFVLPAGEWLGGRNYLRNLFAAIDSAATDTLPENPLVPVVFTGSKTGDLSVDFPRVQIVRTSILDRKSPGWLIRKLSAKVLSHDLVLHRELDRHKITVLSHCFHLGRQSAVKTIGWIPDFQHLHLPEFFTPQELRHRNREYLDLCKRCDRIVVSSESARTDLIAFAPRYAHKAELLRFVASPAPLDRAATLPALESVYNFQGPYFLLPNQFWAHKNHRIVIQALHLLKQRGHPLLVLATGATEDQRNPAFFPTLMSYASECGVLDCFRVLGKIPFDHLVGLMHHAVAFINPSRFEGWSTSVEEAKSMGKQIVLSNLPVHLEQAPARAFYFSVDDPEALASSLLAAGQSFRPDQDAAMQQQAREKFPERQLEYGRTYRNIVGLTHPGAAVPHQRQSTRSGHASS